MFGGWGDEYILWFNNRKHNTFLWYLRRACNCRKNNEGKVFMSRSSGVAERKRMMDEYPTFECAWCKEVDEDQCQYPLSEFGGYSDENEILCKECIFDGRRHDSRCDEPH